MSILAHPEWPLLKRHLRAERYARDTGSRGARVRLEVVRPTDGRELRRLQGIKDPCVTCGAIISKVRERGGKRFKGRLYFSPCCPQDVSLACSRSPKASQEYLAIRAALADDADASTPPPSAQGDLFGRKH